MKKKVLRVGLLQPVTQLDPRQSQDFVSGMVQWQIFETPFGPPFADDPPPTLLFREHLREERPRGGRPVCSAPVRSGVRFSDGTPLTARHVAEALRHAQPLAAQADVEEQGERVFFVLERPNPRFDIALTHRYCAVILEKGGKLLGTGPYVLAPDSRPEEVHLVRSPYYRAPPAIDEVFFRVYPPQGDGRPAALLEALMSGEVDFTNVLSREDLGQLRGLRKWFEPGNSTALLYFNVRRAAVRAPQVRRALTLAVSRNRLTQICYTNALAFKASGLLPPMMGSWRDGIRHNLAKAREILAQPGVVTPRQLSLLLIHGPRPYLPDPRPVAEGIVRQIGELGIRVVVRETRDSEDYYRRAMGGHYDLALSGWIADTPDPADFLESTLGSGYVPTSGEPMANRANLSGFESRRMDAALAAYRLDPTPENRSVIVKLLASETPLLPLMYGPTIVAHSWRVKNFRMSPLGIPFFGTMELQE